MAAEQILIEFVVDSSQLLPHIDILQKLGQITEQDAAKYKQIATESAKAFAAANEAGKKMLPTFNQIEKNIVDVGDVVIDTFQKEIPKAVLKSVADINKQQIKVPVTPTLSPEDISSIKTKLNDADISIPIIPSVNTEDISKVEAQLSETEVEVPVIPVINPATISAALGNMQAQLSKADINFDLLSNASSDAQKLLPFIEKDSAAYKQLSDYILQANSALDKVLSQSQNVNNLTGQLQAALSSKLGDIDFGDINFSKLKDAKATLDSVGDDARKLTGILKATSSALSTLNPNTNEFKTLSQLFESGTVTLTQYDEALKNLSAAEENAGNKQLTFRTQIRASTQALAEQFAAGQLTVSELFQLAKGAGDLENNYENAAQAIRALSSNTFGFDAFAQGVQTATGAMQIFTGVQALAGNENKDFQQTMLKLNSLFNISIGLQQVVNNFQKQSSLVLGAQIVLEKTLNFVRTGSFQTTKQIAAATQTDVGAKEADTIATAELTVATTASSVAMQVFRVALLATGIGAVIILVGALVSALSEFTSNASDAAEAEKDLADTIEKTNESIQAQIDFINKSGGIASDKIKTELDLAEKRGASENELFAIREKLYNQELTTAKQAQDAAIKRAEKEDVNVSNSISGYAALTNAADTYFNDLDALENQRQNNLAALSLAQQKNDKDGIKDAQDKLSATESSLAAARTAYNLYGGVIKNVSDTEISLQELTAEKFKFFNDLRTKDAEANAEALIQIEQRRADHLKSLSENDNFGYGAQLKFLQQFVTQETLVLNLQRAKELQQDNLTSLQRQNIQEKYNDAISKLVEDGYTKRNALIKKNNDELAAQDKLLDNEEKRIQIMFGNVDKDFESINKNNTSGTNNKLKQLADAYINGIIPTTEAYEKIRQNIILDSEKTDLDNQKENIEAKLGNLKGQYDRSEISQQKYNDQSTALSNQLADVDKQLTDKKVEIHKNANDEILANEEQTLQKIEAAFDFINQSLQAAIGETGTTIFNAFEGLYDALQRIKLDDTLDKKGKELAEFAAATQAVQSTVNALFEQTSQQRQQQVQAEIAKLEDLRNAELNNTILTETQKDALNRKFDRQEAAIKNKAAQAQKQSDVSQAIANGALAIIKTFATVAFPFNLVVSALIAGLTARQISIVQSQPLPQFKKGTKKAPPGYAWVGEEGAEIVKLRGGETIYTTKESRIIEKRWEKERLKESYIHPVIIGDFKLKTYDNSVRQVISPYDKIASLIPQPVDKEIIERSYKETMPAEIDYDKLAEKIGERVAKHQGKIEDTPQSGLVEQADRIYNWIQKKNERTIYLNKKSKLTKK